MSGPRDWRLLCSVESAALLPSAVLCMVLCSFGEHRGEVLLRGLLAGPCCQTTTNYTSTEGSQLYSTVGPDV